MNPDERGAGGGWESGGGRKEALEEGCVSGERHVGFVGKSAMAYVLSYTFTFLLEDTPPSPPPHTPLP